VLGASSVPASISSTLSFAGGNCSRSLSVCLSSDASLQSRVFSDALAATRALFGTAASIFGITPKVSERQLEQSLGQYPLSI